MQGSIRKRGEKWYYSFEAATIKGKRKRIERVAGRTKKEAETALRKALQTYENAGVHFEPSEISVADYMDYWCQNYMEINCKYNTQKAYGTIINNYITPLLGKYRLKSLTPAVLQGFLNTIYRKKKVTKRYLDLIYIVFSSALKYAVHPAGFISENPFAYVKKPKYEHTKSLQDQKVITPEQFQKILDLYPFGTNYHIMFMIGYYTGCRIGEVGALTWQDIDFQKGIIDINKNILRKKRKSQDKHTEWFFGSTKTSTSMRKIQIGKTLLKTLQRHHRWQKENRLLYGEYYTDYCQKEGAIIPVQGIDLSPEAGIHFLCTRQDGTIITPESFSYAAKKIKQLGFAFNFHSLRHTHATILIESGANMKDVQARLGHSSITTTMNTYTHATEKMANQSVDLFEKAVNRHLPTLQK